MQYTPSQLKEKLLEGIDNEYNVVDMPKVLEVICLLEKCPITREVLEDTRIGRLVNDVRRKTSDKQLARKAKDLVRSWQKVVNGSDSTPTVNGDGVNTPSSRIQGDNKALKSPVLTPVKPTTATPVNKLSAQKSVKSSLSHDQLIGKPNTPTLQQNSNNDSNNQQSIKRSHSSSHIHPSSAKRVCRSPGAGSTPATPDSIGGQNNRAAATTLPHTPSSQSLPDTPLSSSSEKKKFHRTPSNDSFSGKQKSTKKTHSPESPSDTEDKSKSGQNGIIISRTNFTLETPPPHSIENKGLKTTIRLKSPAVLNGETPKKRGRGRPPKSKPQIIASSTFEPPPSNGSTPYSKSFIERKNVHLGLKTDCESPGSRNEKFISMTPKVKSTAELMQSLQEKNNLSVGKDTARQISANLIPKESDPDHYSVVPEGARPRHHKKKGSKNDLVPPSTPVSLNKTKTEMVQKFLESSVTETNPDDLSPLKYELPRTESPGNASTSFEDSVDGNQDSSKTNLMDASKHDQSESKSVIGREISPHKLKNSQTEPQASSSKETLDPSSSAECPLTLEEIYSKYPPLDLENFVFDDDTYEVAEPVEITDSDIQRIHTGHWMGVNGCQDMFNDWRDWSQTLSLSSYNGDPLHILPYVCIDD